MYVYIYSIIYLLIYTYIYISSLFVHNTIIIWSSETTGSVVSFFIHLNPSGPIPTNYAEDGLALTLQLAFQYRTVAPCFCALRSPTLLDRIHVSSIYFDISLLGHEWDLDDFSALSLHVPYVPDLNILCSVLLLQLWSTLTIWYFTRDDTRWRPFLALEIWQLVKTDGKRTVCHGNNHHL